MPRSQKIYFTFINDQLDGLQKLALVDSAKIPHAGRDGEFIWELTNNTGMDIDISLENFTNKNGLDVNAFLKFTPQSQSRHIADSDSDIVRAKVKKTNSADVKFTYEVWIDGTMIDPELIVDGGGPGPKEPTARKAGKKTSKKK